METIFTEERHQKILNKLAAEQRIYANELAQLFNVSVDTIRRDLTYLEQKGLLKRTHGGAIPANKVRGSRNYPLAEVGEQFQYYHGIARKAVEYIAPGDTVYIYGAKAQFLMVQYLPTDIKFTIVTNSVDIANQLKNFPNIEGYMVGGKLTKSGNINGSIAAEFIKSFRFDVCFMNARGFSARQGLSRGSADAAILDRTLAAVSRKVICLLPHEKLGYDAFISMLPAKAVDVVITDPEACADELASLRELGIEVVVAD